MWSPRKLRNPILLAVVLFLLAMGVVTAWAVQISYNHYRSQIMLRATSMTQVLAEYTLRNMAAVDLTLKTIIDSSPMQHPQNDAQLRDWMTRRLADLPDVRSLFVIGADGLVRHNTDSPNTSRLSLADRNYFRFHERADRDQLYIGQPLLSRTVDRWFVSVSRRIDGPRGEFAGVAAAAVEPTFYERIYRQLPLGPKDSISLWHEEGHLIARYPDDMGLVGRRMSNLPIFQEHLPERKTGKFVANGPATGGTPQAVGYQQLPNMPLIVTTGLSLESISGNLRPLLVAILAMFGLLSALAIAMPILIFRRIREREENLKRDLVLQKSEALARMTSGLAHDFNNVLAAVEAGIKLMTRHASDPDKVQQFASEAGEAVARGSRLAGQLLQFAKQKELSFQQADINELLRQLEPMLNQGADGINLHLNLQEGLPACVLDRTQFDAAILNLVINAKDAMPNGGDVTIKTTKRVEKRGTQSLKPGEYVRVQVSDNGPGMPPEVMQRVFEPYFSTKGENGTGLGLPQVRSFMEQLGGSAMLSSSRGRGTRVELFFPCDTASTAKPLRTDLPTPHET
ncbi:hybrid sensor histidine kinase/response regulator [Chelativorans sp. YIM 93263]|uniref:hybrid sensor histidine kinase/response regulator n=1 Tax=Chelativorans sp. YIM 93263 TaxID=2906648 RepID=UPI0023783F45|nr:hybrid sensor histidine kinase/response regulator [Chelativorans sp. YIM 93263]